MPKILRQVLSLFLLIVFLSSAIMSLTRLQDPLPPWIAFSSNRDGNNEIYRMRWDGSEQKRLTYHKGLNEYPSWSPDGAWIIFTSFDSGVADIYRMHPGEQDIQVLPSTEDLYRVGAQWSPDGQWILFGSNYESDNINLTRMRPDGSDIQQLTANGHVNFWASWSPDSQYIVFVSRLLESHQIYRINANGDEQIALTDNTSINDSPTWSPDGEWVLFTSMGDIYRVRPDGSELELFLGIGEGLMTIRWADHQHLLLTIMNQVASHIYRYNIETEEMTQLTYTGDNYNPIPSPIIDLPWRGLVMMLFSFLLLGFTFPTRKFILTSIRLLANRS